MQLSKLIIFACLFLLSAFQSGAQTALADTKTRFFGVPILFYSPDTRLGGGAAGIITFAGQPFRSSITFGLAYTQRKQFLIYLPYQIYGTNANWRAYGELGYYRYNYQYFGIGNNYSNDFIEQYTGQYPRIRINALSKIKPHQFVGIRWAFDAYKVLKPSDGGEIASGLVSGSGGGNTSSIGPVWLLDNRDNQFYPGKGWFVEAFFVGSHRLTGSDFRFARFSLDAVHYYSLGKRHKLAFNFYAVASAKGAPFFNLAQIGGTRRLRGYPDGKYRDRHLLMLQSEWRFPVFWRFKGVLFGGGGAVFGTSGEAPKFRPNLGLGLRFEFDKKQQLHLRVDYGIGAGKGNSGVYITIGEAF